MTLTLTIIWIVITLLITGSFILPSYPRKNIILETTIPKNNLDNINIKNIAEEYRKKIYTSFTFFILYSFLIYYSNSMTIIFLLFTVGLIIELIYNYLTEIRFIRKMTALKQYFNWNDNSSNTVFSENVNLNELISKKIPSPILYLVAIIIIAFEFSYALHATFSNIFLLIISTITFFIVATFIWSATSIRKASVKKLTSNDDINIAIANNNKFYWITSLTHGAIIFSLIPLPVILFYRASYFIAITAIVIYLLVISLWLFLFLNISIKSKMTEDKLLAYSGKKFQQSDYSWRYVLYNNPIDTRLRVKNRTGLQTSINIGRMTGKITIISSFIALMVILITTFVTLLNTEISNSTTNITFTKDAVQLSGLASETSTIKYKNIKNVQLVTELPKVKKVAGINTSHIKTGLFKNNDKTIKLYIKRNQKLNNKIIKISTSKDTYYFSNNKVIQNTYKKLVQYEK